MLNIRDPRNGELSLTIDVTLIAFVEMHIIRSEGNADTENGFACSEVG